MTVYTVYINELGAIHSHLDQNAVTGISDHYLTSSHINKRTHSHVGLGTTAVTCTPTTRKTNVELPESSFHSSRAIRTQSQSRP